MKRLPFTLVRTSELPFYKDVHALIKRHPEYLLGIRKGVVHIGFNPGHREGMKRIGLAPVQIVTAQANVAETVEGYDFGGQL